MRHDTATKQSDFRPALTRAFGDQIESFRDDDALTNANGTAISPRTILRPHLKTAVLFN